MRVKIYCVYVFMHIKFDTVINIHIYRHRHVYSQAHTHFIYRCIYMFKCI